MQTLHSIPAWERMCYTAEDRSNNWPIQMLSEGSGMLLVPVQAAVLLLEGNRRILQTKQSRQLCSKENSSIW